jgi:hypothetical protein
LSCSRRLPLPSSTADIGRIAGGDGWKARGRAGREHTHDRTGKIGYDYVHSQVDHHVRLAYFEVLPDEKAAPAPGSSTAPPALLGPPDAYSPRAPS